jgi:hypothetical protein
VTEKGEYTGNRTFEVRMVIRERDLEVVTDKLDEALRYAISFTRSLGREKYQRREKDDGE